MPPPRTLRRWYARLSNTRCRSFLTALCLSNEVLVAIGCDADGNGDLSFEETAFVFGCDCGERYLVDYVSGIVDDTVGETVVVGWRSFDPAWNMAKVVKRGAGTVGETIVETVLNKRFDITIR